MQSAKAECMVIRILQLLRVVLGGLIIFGAVLPLYLLGKQSITSELETFAWPVLWIPHHLTLAHFADVFAVAELRNGMIRSLFVATIAGIGATALGAMLAYSMARNPMARRGGLSTLSGVRLLPMITIALPLGVALAALRLSDSPTALGLAGVHTAIAIPTAALTLYASFLGVPLEVEEAAWMDGASQLRIFLTIDLPMVRGALVTAFILCFILSWDEFGFSLLLQQTNRTLPPLLYYYTVFGNVGPASALALLMLIPAIVLIVALGPRLRDAMLAGGYR